ncbi:MAG: sodium:solute symporter family transporter [Planctomycetota bacterium]
MDPTIITVAGIYFLITLGLGFWVARNERNRTEEYFLAGRKLPWYAVSMSMTGSNMGTEHFIGMVGTAYAFGLAPATFEWGNFLPYSALMWIFIPFLYRKKLFTIPEFFERRYNVSTRGVFACFTMLHMVFVVLAPALYAGGRILYEMTQRQPIMEFNWLFMGCVLIIAGATAAYCIYGGLLSVVWTDVLQVVILVVGGFLLTIIGIQSAGGIEAVIEGNQDTSSTGYSRFNLILPASHPISPWTGVFTFWFTLSMWYVGTNQFYIQRCLGAKSEWDAKMGVVGCAYLKILMPLIVVIPGMVAFAKFGPGLAEDAVYIKMINEFLPPVGQGLLLAVLIAAIMSTVSSVLNSASTIWSMDVHKRLLHKEASEAELVKVGRWSTFVIIVIGALFAPILLKYKGGIFVYIQDTNTFIAPPICIIYLSAFLWRRTHGRAATFTLLFGLVSGILLKLLSEMWGTEGIESLKPLLNRAAVNCFLCLIILVIASYVFPKKQAESYDPDVIWSSRWGRLPASERSLNRGGRNLMFWWVVLVVGSTGLFVWFR